MAVAEATGPRGSAGVRADLRASLGDGVAFSAMLGAGEAYLPAFALALGHGEVAAGLMATVPFLLGAIVQVHTPTLLGLVGSHRRLQVGLAVAQALCFGPLFWGAWRGSLPVAVLFGVAGLYWAITLGSTPPWSSWLESLVPRSLRSRFFARRSQACQLATLSALVAGGLWLDRGGGITAFCGLFAVAAAARLVSGAFVLAHRDVPPDPEARPLGLVGSLRALCEGPRGRLLAGLAATQAGAQVASGFYCPYMFEVMGTPATAYTGVVAAGILGRVVALPFLGNLAARHGAGAVLLLGGVGIVPTPFLWSLTTDARVLLAIEFASGAAWAAYELGVFLVFFDLIPRAERTRLLTIFNLVLGVAMCTGAALGAGLLARAAGLEGYRRIFLVSSALRLVALVLVSRIRTVGVPFRSITFRPMAARPAGAAMGRPVLPGVEPPTSQAA